MSIRGIIEAATPGPWEVRGCIVPGEAIDYCYKDGNVSVRAPVAATGVCDNKRLNPKSDARFIATFDPEHVALMEAERVAARAFITDRASGAGFAIRKYDEWVDACEATDAYRKERGL